MKKYLVKLLKSIGGAFHEFDDMESVNKFLHMCGYFKLSKAEQKQRFAIYRRL